MFSLNTAQSEAVESIHQNTLVLAGAGTGKTRIIIAKIFYLLRQGVSPRQILAITFTNKAANEMKTRVDGLLKEVDQNRLGLQIRTFHSFGAYLLRSFIQYHPPYTANFSIIDDTVQKQIIKDHLEEKFSSQEIQFLIKTFSDWKSRFIYPEDKDFPAILKEGSSSYRRMPSGMLDPTSDFVIDQYQRYCKHLAENNLLDFDDLIGMTVRILQNHRECREMVIRRWKYVLVDEYQDTNHAQEKLIEIFVKSGCHMTVVGDDSQSIYSFRGAEIENILTFENKYASDEQPVRIVKLEENYRSTQSILNMANRVISKNPVLYEKSLFTQNSRGAVPFFQRHANEYMEVDWILDQIRIAHDGGIPLQEIAVLYRTNYQSRLLEDRLVRSQIPYQIIGGFRFYERKEVKEVLHYLQFLINPLHSPAFFFLLNFPARGFGEKSLTNLKDYLAQPAIQQKLALDEDGLISVLTEEHLSHFVKSNKLQKVLLHLGEMLVKAREMIRKEVPISKVVDFVIHESGIYHYYSELKNSFERDQRMGNIDAFMDAVIYYEDLIENGDLVEDEENFSLHPLQQFIEQVSLGIQDGKNRADDGGENEEEHGGVKLLTVHNAKGLEYEYVFIMGMEQGIFPHYISLEENNLEEERRLFYVAVTRAKQNLIISSSESKRKQGFEQYYPISEFITEMDENVLNKEIPSMEDESEYF